MGIPVPLGLGHQPVLQRRAERRVIIWLIVAFWLAFQAVFLIFGTLDQSDEAVSARDLLVGLLHYIVRPSEIAIVSAGAVICFLAYLVLGLVIFLQQRELVGPLLRDGFRTSYRELALAESPAAAGRD